MRDYIEERIYQAAAYIIENGATVRDAAKVLKISKSTVHKDVSERLTQLNPQLAQQVRLVLDKNKAERHIREAKKTFADILKCTPQNIYFTSCGTESDNISLIGAARANLRSGKHLITTAIEHPAILETMKYLESEGFEVTILPVDHNGRVDPEAVYDAVREDTTLVSVMHTNNEIGALEPIAEIGRRIKEKNPNTLFHVDAVQGFCKAIIQPKKMHIDLLSASGHKIHAPKGIGLLYIGDHVKIHNIMYGGGQQKGMRSGTENVAGIAGMALAARMLYQDLDAEMDRLYAMKEQFVKDVTAIEGVTVNGLTGRDSAPHVISISVDGVRAEVLLHALEEKGIYVSSGSACAYTARSRMQRFSYTRPNVCQSSRSDSSFMPRSATAREGSAR